MVEEQKLGYEYLIDDEDKNYIWMKKLCKK
jgi:hypothetical protein